jgi:1-aminocyclopropane-1-carboxylate deaminase/D-cysteine desulfhydrase-like pyridoxal-dependent ACC family enzyme
LAKQAFPSESPDIIFMHTGGVFGIFPHASGVEAALGRA